MFQNRVLKTLHEPKRILKSEDVECPSCGAQLYVGTRAYAGMLYDCINCGSELELEENSDLEETVELRFLCRPDSRTSQQYEVLGAIEDVPAGQHKVFPCRNREIVVFAVDGEYYAMKNLCPHHGVALAGGTLENGTVRCPGHGFRFNIKTGECEKDPSLRASILDVKVEDGKLMVRIG